MRLQGQLAGLPEGLLRSQAHPDKEWVKVWGPAGPDPLTHPLAGKPCKRYSSQPPPTHDPTILLRSVAKQPSPPSSIPTMAPFPASISSERETPHPSCLTQIHLEASQLG